MTYRVRRQAITGKLILQFVTPLGLVRDASSPPPMIDFEICHIETLRALESRVAKSEKRAAGQRKAYAEKKAKQ